MDRVGKQMERAEKKALGGDDGKKKKKFDWAQLPDVIALIKPRRGIIAIGFRADDREPVVRIGAAGSPPNICSTM